LFGDAPGAATRVARLRNGSTGPAALRARGRHREESLLAADLSLPAAQRADDGRAARRRARSAAAFARFLPRNLDRRFGAASGVFERNLEVVAQIGAALRATAPAAAEQIAETEDVAEAAENVFEPGKDGRIEAGAGSSCGAHASMTESVVQAALFRVSEDR